MPPQDSAAPRRGALVLLAEHNPVNQRVAVLLLTRLGLVADVVANGRLAVEALDRCHYDCVLMACQMPGMDGFEATAEIRRRESHHRRVPIIAMTAQATTGDREKSFAAGMDDSICNPLTAGELQLALARVLVMNLPRQDAPLTLDESVLAVYREMCCDDTPDPVRELTAVFLEDANHRLAQLREAATLGDGTRLRAVAHSLRGMCGAIGALRMSEMSLALEQTAFDADQSRGELLSELAAEFARVRAALLALQTAA
jgi:CheY-like chemotaxis protein/HPt (histidine-containing phosphotransfer) domain-containing protein